MGLGGLTSFFPNRENGDETAGRFRIGKAGALIWSAERSGMACQGLFTPTNCHPDRSFSFPKGMRSGVEGPAVCGGYSAASSGSWPAGCPILNFALFAKFRVGMLEADPNQPG
jgi:hypothetical protein